MTQAMLQSVANGCECLRGKEGKSENNRKESEEKDVENCNRKCSLSGDNSVGGLHDTLTFVI